MSMKKSVHLRVPISFLLCILGLAFATSAFAGDPIPGVDVHLQPKGGAALAAKTGTDGMFSFENLPPGTYTLWISQAQCVKAVSTKSAVGRESPTLSTAQKFAVVCDDGNDIIVAALQDSDGNGALDRDAAKAQTTGKRMHKPFVITKEWSASSPGLQVTVSGNGKKDFKGHVTLLK
jgi:hypothetical protein